MAAIKAYTDINQSRKLAEFLPIGSADMLWSRCTITDFSDGVLKVSYAVEPCNISQFRNTKEDIPCWSLAALLSVLPKGYSLGRRTNGKYYVCMTNIKHNISEFDNPIDACVYMIEQLYKLKML